MEDNIINEATDNTEISANDIINNYSINNNNDDIINNSKEVEDPALLSPNEEVKKENCSSQGLDVKDLTQDNIDAYFKSENVYNEVHNQLFQNDKEYHDMFNLWQNGNVLQNYLMQHNSNFSNTNDVNVKADILYEAKQVLENQIQERLNTNIATYRGKVADYVATQQFNKYLEDNISNLTGINKLVDNLYSTITEKAGLGIGEDSRNQVGNALNNALFSLANQFKIDPKDLINVLDNFSSKKEMEDALTHLTNNKQTNLLAKNRAKSITNGGSDVNKKTQKLQELDDFIQTYSI